MSAQGEGRTIPAANEDHAPPSAEIFDWRAARNAKREHEFERALRKMGLHNREMMLLKVEAMGLDADYWHRKAMTARYLTDRLLAICKLAHEREAQSAALLEDAYRELARVRGLVE